MSKDLIPVEIIENKIYIIRGHRVMLDSDLGNLYDVETRVLNQAVNRNIDRFPEDFMFQLSDDEWKTLISQFVISNKGRGGRQKLPYMFTEYGVLMLSNILNSKRAVAVSIQIVRVFTKLREIALTHKDIAKQLNELEYRFIEYTKDNSLEQREQNQKINDIFKCLEHLVEIHKPGQIGFKTEEIRCLKHPV